MRHAPQRMLTGNRFTALVPTADIAPVDGWALHSIECWDGDGFFYNSYVARGPVEDRMLDLCRFRFTPSQDRFAWLVRNGFPARRGFGPWDDTSIEHEITAVRSEVAA